MKDNLANVSSSSRGQSSRLAKALQIHPSLLSQIIKGDRNLTLEQAALYCDYLHLSEYETDYFLKMVEYERAGNPSLKQKLSRQLANLKSEFQDIKTRVIVTSEKLNETERATFYSSWHFSAIRMLLSLERYSAAEVSEILNLPMKTVLDTITFLTKTGLVIENDGQYTLGKRSTHIEAKSYWSTRHHLNWRVQNLKRLDRVDENEVCFTAPFSCSKKDYAKIREKLLSYIEEASKIVETSPAEQVHTLCVDLFQVTKN